jgi:hypothetical protein
VRVEQEDEGHSEVAEGAQRPWGHLDPAMARALEPELPSLADECIAEIGRTIAEYRRPLEGSFGQGLRAGVQRALQQFVDRVGHPEEPDPPSFEVYRELGRGELRAGRGLDALQAAYRLGARLSWRRLSAVARAQGADAATVSLLAEAIFAHIEAISASSIEGYAQAQAERAGERERRRRRVVRLLLESEEPLEERTLLGAALEAGWELPATLAALACGLQDASRLAASIGGEAIGARMDELTCVLIPEPDAPGRREQIVRALERVAADAPWCAALGPGVSRSGVRLSFARARETLLLHQRAILAGGGLLVSSEHLLPMLLHADPAIGSELVRRRLEPLLGLSDPARRRLGQTLLSWLRHQGSIVPVALELSIHRQTVRYRLGQLRELFGSDLDDPEARLEIELALRIARAQEIPTIEEHQ